MKTPVVMVKTLITYNCMRNGEDSKNISSLIPITRASQTSNRVLHHSTYGIATSMFNVGCDLKSSNLAKIANSCASSASHANFSFQKPDFDHVMHLT